MTVPLPSERRQEVIIKVGTNFLVSMLWKRIRFRNNTSLSKVSTATPYFSSYLKRSKDKNNLTCLTFVTEKTTRSGLRLRPAVSAARTRQAPAGTQTDRPVPF